MYAITDELIHYGVLGMKWGVRHDKPSKGRRRSSSGTASTSKKPVKKQAVNAAAKQSTEKGFIDPMTAVALAEISLFLIAPAIASLAKKFKYRKIRADDKAAHDIKENAKPVELNKGTNTSETREESMKAINPDYPDTGTTYNCVSCSFAYDMRRRGYDVEARKMSHGLTDAQIEKVSDAKPKQMAADLALQDTINQCIKTRDYKPIETALKAKNQELFDTIAAEGDGARGIVAASWMWGGGHAMAWENVDGETRIFDTQSNESYNAEEFFKDMGVDIDYIEMPPTIIRLDNATYNENIYNVTKARS